MTKISTETEKVLHEILDHRDEQGNCDSEYWKNRFEGLSIAEDAVLRSSFKELKEADMISVKWADDYPYLLFLLAKGISYFEDCKLPQERNDVNSYTNNFYGSVSGIQIQQGTHDSTQNQTNGILIDEDKLISLIRMIRKYDSVLEQEFGSEDANRLRNCTQDLENSIARKDPDSQKARILSIIKDISTNAIGGIISSVIVQLISGM